MKTSREVVEETELVCDGCNLLITYSSKDYERMKATNGRIVYGIACPDCRNVFTTIDLENIRNKKGFWKRLFTLIGIKL